MEAPTPQPFTLRFHLHPDVNASLQQDGEAVLLGVGFSVGVGVIFGLLPAFKAAILQPIDALRYE